MLVFGYIKLGISQSYYCGYDIFKTMKFQEFWDNFISINKGFVRDKLWFFESAVSAELFSPREFWFSAGNSDWAVILGSGAKLYVLYAQKLAKFSEEFWSP